MRSDFKGSSEKDRFLQLLADLCKGIESPEQTNGRPRLPLGDMVFASAFKVYSTASGRRFTCDLKDAHSKGYLTKAPHYNSISRYLENPGLTPILTALIEESSLPLQAIESDFAVDSSGFSTSRFTQWMHAKYTDPHLIQKRDFLKCHLMVGVKTHIVTAVEITGGFEADSPKFEGLVKATAKNFVMQEISADKAYLSAKNLQVVVDHHAQPYIPFKTNSTLTNRWAGHRRSGNRCITCTTTTQTALAELSQAIQRRNGISYDQVEVWNCSA